MLLIHDALGYEQLGTLLYREGWGSYFKNGPLREPLYPFLVSLSMRIAEAMSLPYQTLVKCFHIAILIFTQLLTLKILSKLKVNTVLCACVVLSIGFSPAIVHSALSLYSEILTYPFILLIILLASSATLDLKKKPHTQNITQIKHTAYIAFTLGLTFLGLTLQRAVFEFIVPVFILFYLISAFKMFRDHDKQGIKKYLTFLLILSCIYYVPLNAYKLANKQANGHYTLTNRGARALYGNIARRLEGGDKELIMAAYLSVPDIRLCQKFMTSKSCSFWSYEYSDILGHQRTAQLGLTKKTNAEIDNTLIKESLKNIYNNSLLSALFMSIESLKLIFWETTGTSFAVYPDWLELLYSWPPFYILLSTCSSLASLFGISFLCVKILFNKSTQTSNQDDERHTILLMILVLILAFIGWHSFFLILKRYLLPMAPLLLISFVYGIQSIFLSEGGHE